MNRNIRRLTTIGATTAVLVAAAAVPALAESPGSCLTWAIRDIVTTGGAAILTGPGHITVVFDGDVYRVEDPQQELVTSYQTTADGTVVESDVMEDGNPGSYLVAGSASISVCGSTTASAVTPGPDGDTATGTATPEETGQTTTAPSEEAVPGSTPPSRPETSRVTGPGLDTAPASGRPALDAPAQSRASRPPSSRTAASHTAPTHATTSSPVPRALATTGASPLALGLLGIVTASIGTVAVASTRRHPRTPR